MGSGAVLLALTSGGRRLADRVRRAGRGPGLQRALGGVMMVTAALMFAMVDVRFEQALARHLPDVTPTAGLSSAPARSAGASPTFAATRGSTSGLGARRAARRAGHGGGDASAARPRRRAGLHRHQRWFNTPGGRPLTLAALRGRVVLVDFWTYTCINCIRTLPFLPGWTRSTAGTG